MLAAVLLLSLGATCLYAQQEDIIRRAREALEAGRYDLAQELAESATGAFPQSTEAWMVLGASLDRQPGKDGPALEAYRKVVALAPDHPEAHLAIGRIHLERMRRGVVEVEALSAIRSFDRVIELIPSHPQAYWLRGVAYLEGLGDTLNAGADFERQLGAVPGHPDASVYLLQLAVDTGERDLAEKLTATMLLELKWDTRIYRPMLRLYIERGEWYAAALIARRYLAVLPAGELDAIFDLSPLLPASRKGAYRQLGYDARQRYWRSYWGERGGASLENPSTRLLEHIWRVSEARALFGQQKFPWDIRGELFVRYGPPDHRITSISGTSIGLYMDGPFQSRLRSRMLDVGMPYAAVDELANFAGLINPVLFPGSERSGERFEIWLYMDEGLLFRFHDPLMRNEFRLAYPVDQQVNDRLITRLPVISEVEESTEPLRPMLQTAQFRGREGKTRLHTYLSLPVIELVGSVSDPVPDATLTSAVTLANTNFNVVADETRHRWLQAGPASAVQRSRRFVEAVSLLVGAGQYWLSVFVEHSEADRTGSFGPRMIEVRDYSGTELTMSDVVLASTDTLGAHEANLLDEGMAYLPQPGGVFDLERPLVVYFEVYNLSQDPEGISTYDLTYEVFPEPRSRLFPDQIASSVEELPVSGERTPAVSLTSTYRSLRPDVVHTTALSMEGHPEDFYRLRVRVTDALNGNRVSRETTFRVLYSVYPPTAPPPP